MKWSWRLGKLAGIDVYVHATFLLLIGWIVWSTWAAGKDVTATLAAVAFILALFACVVLHELGHALTARRYGIPTRDITAAKGRARRSCFGRTRPWKGGQWIKDRVDPCDPGDEITLGGL